MAASVIQSQKTNQTSLDWNFLIIKTLKWETVMLNDHYVFFHDKITYELV